MMFDLIPHHSKTVLEEATPAILIAKAAGAFAGSFISIAYVLPRGRRDALLRFAVGMVTGIVFGTTAGLKIASTLDVLDHITSIEITLMGATATSLSAWWGLGVLQRMAEQLPAITRKGAAKPAQWANSDDSKDAQK